MISMEQDTAAVDTPGDRLHPDGCGFEGSCTDAIVSDAMHYGRRMAWFPPQEDGARLGLVLGYGEDHLTRDPIGGGCRWMDLSITTRPGIDDDPVTVSLSADDARFLARQLEAYAKELDHEPSWMTRQHLGISCTEYAVELGILMQHPDGTVTLAETDS